MPPAADEAEGQPPTFRGVLCKFSIGRGPLSRKNWKERWCSADEDALRYYACNSARDGPKGDPKGEVRWRDVVDLYDTVTAEVHPQASDPAMCYFALRFRDAGRMRLLLLRTPSEQDRHAWLQGCGDRMGLRLTREMVEELEEEEEIERPGLDEDKGDGRAADESDARRTRPVVSAIHVLKGLVSKKKKRFVKDDFNLDLVYCTAGKRGRPSLIAMGFPAQGTEALYRNSMDDVERFFLRYHPGKYKVYNLCSEKGYSADKLEGRWVRFGFEDHNPPPLELVPRCLSSMHAWLSRDADNVAAVHCKAGKGRTGTIICAYLCQYCDMVPEEALRHFGEQRTQDGKGVTIPSQKRYVQYSAQLHRSSVLRKLLSDPPAVRLRRCALSHMPRLSGLSDGSAEPYLQVFRRRQQTESPQSLQLQAGSAPPGLSKGLLGSGPGSDGDGSGHSGQGSPSRERGPSSASGGGPASRLTESRRSSLPQAQAREPAPAVHSLAASLGNTLARGRDLLMGTQERDASPSTTGEAKGPWEVVWDSRSAECDTSRGHGTEAIISARSGGAAVGAGDLRFAFHVPGGVLRANGPEMFHFWLHSAFVPTDGSPLVLRKAELDGAHKDKHHVCYDEDFRVTVHFSPDAEEPGGSPWVPQFPAPPPGNRSSSPDARLSFTAPHGSELGVRRARVSEASADGGSRPCGAGSRASMPSGSVQDWREADPRTPPTRQRSLSGPVQLGAAAAGPVSGGAPPRRPGSGAAYQDPGAQD